MPPAYPPARTVDQSDVYHGVAVQDPFRWMEDVSSPDLAAWLEAQGHLTRGFLDAVGCRDAFRARLTELSRLPGHSTPVRRAGRWFQGRRPADEDAGGVYVLDDPADATGRLLLDASRFGDEILLADTEPSPDGRRLLWSETRGGSDWKTWKVLDVESGEPLQDEVTEAKLWACWLPDSSGFLYITFPATGGSDRTRPTADPHLFLHRLGTPPSSDELVFHNAEQPCYYFPSVTDDGRHVVLNFIMGPGSGLARAEIGRWEFERLVWVDEALWLLGSHGDTLYAATSHSAPYGRVVAIDPADPEPASWRTVVPETDHPLPINARSGLVGDHVFAVHDHLGRSTVSLHHVDGSASRDVELPGVCRYVPRDVSEPVGFDPASGRVYFTVTTPRSAATLLRHDIDSRTTEVVFESTGAPDLDITSEVVWAPSEDGTLVPMTLVSSPGHRPADEPPVIVEGYGGGGDIQEPYDYKPWKVAWLEAGGVVATAHLRGGGELGAEWQKAAERGGKLLAMQDFIGCAEHLVSTGVTSAPRIAITGRSSGGMLAAAAAVSRPDLFGACVPEVGMFDPLRYHLFGLGSLMIAEYGTSEVEEDFRAMYAYSPLHNIREDVSYPAFLITVHLDDDRVLPGSGYKFAATLQRDGAGPAPVLVLTRKGAGHFGGSVSGEIDERADILAFLGATVGLPGCGGEGSDTPTAKHEATRPGG